MYPKRFSRNQRHRCQGLNDLSSQVAPEILKTIQRSLWHLSCKTWDCSCEVWLKENLENLEPTKFVHHRNVKQYIANTETGIFTFRSRSFVVPSRRL